MLQFDLGYNEDGQQKNGPCPAATGNRPDGSMFPDKLESVMWLELTSLWKESLTELYIRKKSSYNKPESE